MAKNIRIWESIINSFTCAYFTKISAFVFLKSWNLHKKITVQHVKTIDNIWWCVWYSTSIQVVYYIQYKEVKHQKYHNIL